MKSVTLAGLELRRFRGGLRRLVPVVLILVPLLYGSLYLWSNWNPYGRLNQVPVAVVNQDHPAVVNGERINAGQQFIQQLKATDIFDWKFTDAPDAADGLRQGRYYFTITVPPNFSAKLATASQPEPQHASVNMVRNDANGFIVGIMADTVQTRLQNQINSATHAAYARALYGQLATVRNKLGVAAQAADRLVSGTELNQQGTAALTRGVSGLRSASGKINQGVETTSRAAAELNARVTRATDLAAGQLPGVTQDAANATGAARKALAKVKRGTSFLADATATGVSQVQQLGAKHPDLTADPLFQQTVDNLSRIASSARDSDNTADMALSAATGAHARAVAARDNAAALQSRIRDLATPTATLSAGTQQLAAGSGQLTSGLDGLVDGAHVLQSGAGQLNGGAHDLADAIHNGLNQIPPTNPEQVSRAADVLASPTQINSHTLNPAYVYGRGLAPFFFAIALWVFGLFAYLLLRPVNLRALATRTRALTIALGGWLPAAGLGVLGGLVLFAAVQFGLGLNPVHLLATLGIIVLAAGAFVAIDQFLRTWLGAVGDVLSLVLLIVQLTACGGLYPVETTPAPFQAIHPILPMTYLVDALRITISGGMAEHGWRDAAVLAGFLMAFLALTTWVVHRQRRWTIERLHPQIEL